MDVLSELISAFMQLRLLLTSILQCLSSGYLGIFPILEEFGAFSLL